MPRLIFVLCGITTNTETYSTFDVKILFQIDILPKMLTQKRKRTDLNQARKRLLLSFDKSTNSFMLIWQTKEKKYSFAASLIFFLFCLP